MSEVELTYTPLEITDTDAHLVSTLDKIVTLRNQAQIIATVVSTLDAACTIELLGVLANDSTMVNPSVDLSVPMTDGSSTTQVISLQTDAMWQNIDFRVTAGTIPTTGSVSIAMFAPKERR